MKIPCIVLDDDPLSCELTAMYVLDDVRLDLKGKYTSPEEAITHLEQEDIRLIFLDINMPGINGMNFAKSLTHPPGIIFVSSHAEFALESYEVEAIDYLTKPISQTRFLKAVNKAIERIDTTDKAITANFLLDRIKIENDYFIVRSDAQYIKIKYIDVEYIEALSDFVKIYTSRGSFVAHVNLKIIGNALPESIFVRTHRSFIVNIEHIMTITENTVVLENHTVAIGRSYYNEVMQKIVNDKIIKR